MVPHTGQTLQRATECRYTHKRLSLEPLRHPFPPFFSSLTWPCSSCSRCKRFRRIAARKKARLSALFFEAYDNARLCDPSSTYYYRTPQSDACNITRRPAPLSVLSLSAWLCFQAESRRTDELLVSPWAVMRSAPLSSLPRMGAPWMF